MDITEKEKQTVQFMIALYCHKKHHTKKGEECEKLYAPEMKEKIRDMMKFSGPRMLLYNPVLAMKHMISQ